MTSCQTSNDPNASENRPENPSAGGVESVLSAGLPQPVLPDVSSSPSTGGMKARVNARLAVALANLSGADFKLPLDDSWYIRWGGNNYDLVEIKVPDGVSDRTKVSHQVRAYCGRDLTYALKLYTRLVIADSSVQSAQQLITLIAMLESRIDSAFIKLADVVKV